MFGRSQIQNVIFAVALVGPAAAQSRTPDLRQQCHASGFGTCAVAGLDGPRLDLHHPIDLRPRGDDIRVPAPTDRNGWTNRDKTTIAPEPVTMILLATGLCGIAALGLIRRMRPARIE